MALLDPYKEMTGRGLRKAVNDCLDNGLILIPQPSGHRSHAEDRMEERDVSTPEIESTLRSGVLSKNSCVGGKWRYLARKSDVEVVFTFDVDADGNLLVVVTVMRKQ